MTERDVIDILRADHHEFDRVFRELEELFDRHDEAAHQRRRTLVDQVSIAIVQHSVAEETEVYPRLEKEIDPAEAERSKHEHSEAEETMKRLEHLQPQDPEFDVAVRELIREIREHVAHEEGTMFAELRATFDRDQLVRMAGRVEAVKKVAPTRAHPAVPNEKGVRTVLGPVASAVDHLRDAATGRGKDGD